MTYDTLRNYHSSILKEVQHKWSSIINDDIPIHIIEKAFKMLSKMLEGSYAKYIQFKLSHNRILTNRRLHAMNLRDDDLCSFCDTYP